jgi:hypothetical protein
MVGRNRVKDQLGYSRLSLGEIVTRRNQETIVAPDMLRETVRAGMKIQAQKVSS